MSQIQTRRRVQSSEKSRSGAAGESGSLPAMASGKLVTCPSCGFSKNPPGSVRCGSCGSKIEATTKGPRSREEELERRYQQEGVSIQWLFIAIAVQGVLTAALVFGLPRIVTLLDFEGGNGMIMCVPVWRRAMSTAS